MSTERDQGAGASGAHGAGGEPGGVPNVYHPRNAPAPSYDEYADPATAHGWQNAYDETRELPPVQIPVPGSEREPEPVPVSPAPREPAGGPGRADLRRRRKRVGHRRVAVVAGVLATAGAVAVIAVLAGSGSPGARPHPASGGQVSPDAASARTESGSPTGTATTGAPGVVSSPPVAPSRTAGSAPASTTAPPGGPTRAAATPPGTPTGSPSAPTSAAPTLTSTPTSTWSPRPPGRGHGHGGGSKPGYAQG